MIVSVPETTDNVAEDLAATIEKAKKLGGHGVVTLNAAFYSAANSGTGAIVIDAGNDRNTTPYTIKGLGKDSATALMVGILLANDNVTLDGVKIAVTDKAKAASVNNAYFGPLFIGRYNNGAYLTGENLASRNVTVQNSNITYNTNGSMAAGLFVMGGTATATSYPPEGIKILNNTITAVNTSGSATQGIFIRDYGVGIEVTNNTISSSNTSSGTSDAPASAILIQIHPESIASGDEPKITDNTLQGDEFDFYVTVLYPGSGASTDNHTALVNQLVSDKFGTEDSPERSPIPFTRSSSRRFCPNLRDKMETEASAAFSCP
ncbi:MAG: hypothetical protein LBG08_02295 [Spirochaetaceae bacterium]|nr:hypothetical protein [Spirochaetaceae bacterium]